MDVQPVIGGADADQIRHSTWQTTLRALFAVADPHDPSTKAGVTFRSAPIAGRWVTERSCWRQAAAPSCGVLLSALVRFCVVPAAWF